GGIAAAGTQRPGLRRQALAQDIGIGRHARHHLQRDGAKRKRRGEGGAGLIASGGDITPERPVIRWTSARRPLRDEANDYACGEGVERVIHYAYREADESYVMHPEE